MSGSVRRSLTIEVQQLKRDEDALAPAEQQVTKDCASRAVDASNLAVKDGVLNVKMFSDPCGFERFGAAGKPYGPQVSGSYVAWPKTYHFSHLNYHN